MLMGYVVLPLNMAQCLSRFSLFIVFSVADQIRSESREMTTICQKQYDF